MPLSGLPSQETNNNQTENEMTTLNNIDKVLSSDFNINKIKDFNAKSVDLIFEEKIEESLEILKKIEAFFEGNAIEEKFNIDKKILIIILHNLACCYQKLKDFENCICYLESVIYHFDTSLEQKHHNKVNEEYFIKSFKENQSNNNLLGDLILELRFSAKFHLQMCAVLSQANRHVDALKHAKLAALMCEDNLIKTNYLYIQMMSNKVWSKNKNKKEDEEEENFSEQIKESYKIIKELFTRITEIRNNKNGMNKVDKNIILNHSSLLHKGNLTFNSFKDFRTSEIKEYNSNNNLVNNIRSIFGNNTKKDDWIQLLNIGNIMYLSALNYEDLDLDSDPKYELLRDAILEKVVMLTVSYFCIATELRLLSNNETNKNINGEFFLFKAVEFSSLFLPVSCPIVKHYIVSYYKHYGQDLDVIPEGKNLDIKISLLRSEIEQDKDTLSFVRIKNINYVQNKTGNGNPVPSIGLNINKNSSITSQKSEVIENNIQKFSVPLSFNNDIINNNNNKLKKSIGNANALKNDSNIKKNNFLRNPKEKITKNLKNGNYGILPNKNFLNIAAKSKLNLENKFKLNFENLKKEEDVNYEQENDYEDEEQDKIETMDKIFFKSKIIKKEIKGINNINQNNNNSNSGPKTYRPLNNKIKVKNYIINNKTTSKAKNNCMSSRHINEKNSIIQELNKKGNLTERLPNQKNNPTNKMLSSKTQRDKKYPGKKVIEKKKVQVYITGPIKKDNVVVKKNNNNKITIRKDNIINNSQRPNSSRLYPNKNNVDNTNNFIDKIINDNKKYILFSKNPMSINIKMNINQKNKKSPFVKSVQNKKQI